MFTDIVGYTALMGKDENKAFRILRKNREIQKPLIRKYHGKFLKEIGDGILASFNSSTDAVRCAGEIQFMAKKEEIALRIGIHEGEVVFENGDVLGDGVNVASRLEETAQEGTIYISEAVFRDIKNKSGIKSEFIGEEILKNIDDPVRIYMVECEEVPELNEWSSEMATVGRSIKSKNLIFGGIALIIVFILIWIFYSQRQREVIDPSIVVLPFENLGPEEHTYFTEGMTEEIISLLAAQKMLKVISRKSAVHFAQTDKTIKQIGKELGVNYVLEGSVRWASTPDGEDKVRITAQLIRASDDVHVWTENFDRQLTDIFKIQSDIARKVVEQLGVSLFEKEKGTSETQPTQSLEAYQAYLRGRFYISQPHFSIEHWEKAIDNFEQAVKIDTVFAQAYAELARVNARLYNLRYDLSEKRLKRSDQDAEKALKYGSDLPEVQLSLGYYHLWAYRDFKKAIKYFERAEKNMPNNVDILLAKASIFEPQGNWEELIITLKKAFELSPMDPNIPTGLAQGYWVTRQFSNAVETINKAIELAPNANWPYLYKSYIFMSWLGVSEQSRMALQSVNPEHEFYLWTWFLQETRERNFQAALQLLSDTTEIWINNKLLARPKTLFSAFIYDYLNEKELAHRAYLSSLQYLNSKVEEFPDDPRFHSSLGIAYAGLGQKEKAIKEGLIAIELLPISEDAFYGILYVMDLSIIYTMVGEYELALDQIEYLLKVPSWFSIGWLEKEIRYEPLKSLPRYKMLIAKNESN
jgi:TolB-like protein/Flp pilus assembly protein TadD